MNEERIKAINEAFEKMKENHAQLDRYFQDIYPKLSADIAELFYLYEEYSSQLMTLSLELWKLTAAQTIEMERLAEKAWMYDGLTK